MKKIIFHLQLIGFLFSLSQLSLSLDWSKDATNSIQLPAALELEPPLKQRALEILQAKCNVCHKKQNPFKIFSLKNMDKHAPKIYKQVFVYRRMPKGKKIKLTETEYQLLKDWLKTLNTF